MEVWCLEWWATDKGWFGPNDRVMEFAGEVFDSPEAGKKFVAEEIGYDDVRWFQWREDGWYGRTRSKHRYVSTNPDFVYMQLRRWTVMTSGDLAHGYLANEP